MAIGIFGGVDILLSILGADRFNFFKASGLPLIILGAFGGDNFSDLTIAFAETGVNALFLSWMFFKFSGVNLIIFCWTSLNFSLASMLSTFGAEDVGTSRSISIGECIWTSSIIFIFFAWETWYVGEVCGAVLFVGSEGLFIFGFAMT